MSGHSDDVPRRLARLFERYFEPLGWGQPVESGPVARDGAPVPWITYPAMATLERLTQPGLRVFEFGCGHSSLWWAGKVSEVVGVDHDLAWLEPIRARARPNQTLLHRPVHAPPEPIPAGMAAHIQALIAGQWSSGDSHFDTVHGHNCRDFLGYATSLLAWPQGYFDLIVVDGMARSLCAYLAAHWVRPGGLVVFDNTERTEYEAGYRWLRNRGFARLDFWGPGPVNDFAWCTSLFAQSLAPFVGWPADGAVRHVGPEAQGTGGPRQMAAEPNAIHREIMHTIHGTDIFAGYVPALAEDLQGWNSAHPAFDEIVAAVRPGVIIDVGVWKGGSTIHLAGLMKQHGIAGTVVAVDTFLGSLEHANSESDLFGLIARRHGMPQLYEQFLSNLVRRGVHDRVVPLPQTSTSASKLLHRIGVRAGLIHIDASHEYEDVLQDARSYWDVLAPGGYLVGDDYHPYWASVVRAADEFAAEKGVTLLNRSPKWIVRKPLA